MDSAQDGGSNLQTRCNDSQQFDMGYLQMGGIQLINVWELGFRLRFEPLNWMLFEELPIFRMDGYFKVMVVSACAGDGGLEHEF